MSDQPQGDIQIISKSELTITAPVDGYVFSSAPNVKVVNLTEIGKARKVYTARVRRQAPGQS